MQLLEKEKRFLNVSGKNIKEIRKKQKTHKKKIKNVLLGTDVSNRTVPKTTFFINYINCNIATSAASPLLGPALTILVYPPTFLPA